MNNYLNGIHKKKLLLLYTETITSSIVRKKSSDHHSNYVQYIMYTVQSHTQTISDKCEVVQVWWSIMHIDSLGDIITSPLANGNGYGNFTMDYDYNFLLSNWHHLMHTSN